MNVKQTSARWQAEQESVRARLAAVGVARPAQFAGRSGKEVSEAIFAGERPRAPLGDTLDFVPMRIEPGFAVFPGGPLPGHDNPLVTVHGGSFATLLGSAVGCAVHSSLPAGNAYTRTTCPVFEQPSPVHRAALRPAEVEA